MLALGFAGFFAFGFLLVLLGANQAGLQSHLSLDLSQTGLLASALAGGLGVGVIGAGPLFDRYPRKPLFVAATLLVAAALLSVGETTSFEALLVVVVLAGVGSGGYDTLFNAAVVERYEAASAKPMAILHAATTIGAVLGPLLVAELGHWTTSFHAVGAAHVGLAVAALFVRFPPPDRSTGRKVQVDSVLSAAMLPFAITAFAYVGLEAALTIFAVPYAIDGLSLGEARGQAAISGFWFGLLLGRLAPLALRGHLDARLLVVAGGAGAIAIAGGVGSAVAWIEVLFALCGFGLGIVYPLMISLAGQRFPHARGAAAGVAAGFGALGGFAIPWLSGALGDRLGIEVAVGGLTVWSLMIVAAGAAAWRGRTPEGAIG